MLARRRRLKSLQAPWLKFVQIGRATSSPSSRSWPFVGAIAVLVTLTSFPALAQCVPNSIRPSGFVFIVEGDWTRGAGTRLGRFDPVCPGDEIRSLSGPDRGGSVTIALYDGSLAPPLHCRDKQACDTYQVKDVLVPAEGEFLQRLIHAWARLSPQELDLVAVPGVRGSGPREAVVAKVQGSVDLAPALANVRAGRYSVELRPWTKDGLSAVGTTLEVTWRRPAATVLSGVTPAPGLYQMALADRAGTVLGGALVLLASDADFAAINQAFDHVRGLADKWEDTAGEVAARRLQVEALLAIARDSSVVKGRP
jgi:hypothetical protein